MNTTDQVCQDDLIQASIGEHHIFLNPKNKHEKIYLEIFRSGRKSIDMLIADYFIRPGDVVLDAGANIGFLTLQYLVRNVNAVHAVEPVSNAFNKLQSIKDPKVHLYKVALGDKEGNVKMYLSKSHNQGHTINSDFLSIFPSVFEVNPQIEIVQITKADNLFRHVKFDFMKIDIEGAESVFLEGAKEILIKHPPRAIQIEIYPNDFSKVDETLRIYLPFRMRVGKYHDKDELVFLEPNEAVPENISANPPIFVYTSSPNFFKYYQINE